jgi:two-component system response regulator HydG
MLSRVESASAASETRIAIVDDEEDIISALKLMVRNWGYVVEATANDGTQVVDAIAKKKIHPVVVLMDYRMKEMNGLEAARKIHLLDPSIRIIIESADDSAEAEVKKAGLGYLRKPFTSVQLKGALERALKDSPA